MLQCGNQIVDIQHFPDGTLLMHQEIEGRGEKFRRCTGNDTDKAYDVPEEQAEITWLYDNNEELVALFFLVSHLRSKGVKNLTLYMPYIPNARQDRVKRPEDVFTLKYFAEMINSLKFDKVTVLDPHSYVSEALIDHIGVETPVRYVEEVLKRIGKEVILFYPDEGAMKRYSSMFPLPYVFGIKKRDWISGEIKGLEVAGQTEQLKGRDILIIDDICSKGGTFYYSAKALKELGAGEIYLYVSHCENTITEGQLLTTDDITKIYTTGSIYRSNHDKIEVITGVYER